MVFNFEFRAENSNTELLFLLKEVNILSNLVVLHYKQVFDLYIMIVKFVFIKLFKQSLTMRKIINQVFYLEGDNFQLICTY